MKIDDNIIKYIDSEYIINVLGKTTWKDVEEQDFYIGRASTRIRTIIFATGTGKPDDITSYTPAQQAAIKEATAIYTLYYHDINFDFTSGSISVSFGGANMSESRQYNGEPVLPTVYEILKTVNLIPVIDVINFDFKKNKAPLIDGQMSTPSLDAIWKRLLQVSDELKALGTIVAGVDVKLAGSNTFTGINKFNNIITVPSPTMLASATPREYVDDLIAKIDVSDKASLTQLNNFSGTNNFNGIITTPTEPINNYDVVNKIYSDLENSKTYAKAKLYIDKEIAKIPTGKTYTGTYPIIVNDTIISLDKSDIPSLSGYNIYRGLNEFFELSIFNDIIQLHGADNIMPITGPNPGSIVNRKFVNDEIIIATANIKHDINVEILEIKKQLPKSVTLHATDSKITVPFTYSTGKILNITNSNGENLIWKLEGGTNNVYYLFIFDLATLSYALVPPTYRYLTIMYLDIQPTKTKKTKKEKKYE